MSNTKNTIKKHWIVKYNGKLKLFKYNTSEIFNFEKSCFIKTI